MGIKRLATYVLHQPPPFHLRKPAIDLKIEPMKIKFWLFLLGLTLLAASRAFALEGSIHLVTYQYTGFRVDETEQGIRVRRLLSQIHDMGVRTLIFNFRGRMVGGRSSDIDTITPSDQRNLEEWHLKETIRYAKSLGFEIAIRPILLVVGPKWEFPYTENGFTWWHGNIDPDKPSEWFEQYFQFHQRYLRIASENQAKWYSLGAEMHSMTSGFGERNPRSPHGYPQEWIKLVQRAREIVGPQVQLTYGVNYTDQYVLEEGERSWGGEFEQWRYDMTFLARKSSDIRHQKLMRQLWRSFDFIGLDFYRSLGKAQDTYPKIFSELSDKLYELSYSHLAHLYWAWSTMSMVSGATPPMALQEIGYASVEKCFVAPYLYEDEDAHINYLHQAAAWDALLRAVTMQLPTSGWMQEIGIWQVLVDEDTDLHPKGGFSPLGKPLTIDTIRKYLLLSHTSKTKLPKK